MRFISFKHMNEDESLSAINGFLQVIWSKFPNNRFWRFLRRLRLCLLNLNLWWWRCWFLRHSILEQVFLQARVVELTVVGHFCLLAVFLRENNDGREFLHIEMLVNFVCFCKHLSELNVGKLSYSI